MTNKRFKKLASLFSMSIIGLAAAVTIPTTTLAAAPQVSPNTYSITIETGPGGTVSPLGSSGIIKGATLPLTILPDPGYQIADIFIDGVSAGTSTLFVVTNGNGTNVLHAFENVTANHTFYASFSPIQAPTREIIASAGQNGSISPTGITTVSVGSNQAFDITPANGFQIDTLIVDGAAVSTSSSYTFTNVTAGHSINASFTPKPQPTATNLSINPINGPINIGVSGKFSATITDQYDSSINTPVNWASSNPSIISINPKSGSFKALRAGSTMISATINGLASSISVNVTAPSAISKSNNERKRANLNQYGSKSRKEQFKD